MNRRGEVQTPLMGEVQLPRASSSILPSEAEPPAAKSRDDPANPPPPPPQSSSSSRDPPEQPTPASPRFDPSRMIGIIRRKALIKDLAAVYHAECLSHCPELLELQRKVEEPFADLKGQEDVRKELTRPAKRAKKLR